MIIACITLTVITVPTVGRDSRLETQQTLEEEYHDECRSYTCPVCNHSASVSESFMIEKQPICHLRCICSICHKAPGVYPGKRCEQCVVPYRCSCGKISIEEKPFTGNFCSPECQRAIPTSPALPKNE